MSDAAQAVQGHADGLKSNTKTKKPRSERAQTAPTDKRWVSINGGAGLASLKRIITAALTQPMSDEDTVQAKRLMARIDRRGL